MAKDILAFFGLIFLTLLIIIGVVLVGGFYDSVGMVSLPDGLLQTPMALLTSAPVQVHVSSSGKPEWSSPVDALPIVTLTEPPPPTLTPVPPLAPEVYQAQATERLKRYAAALKLWMDANNRLAQDSSLLDDPIWKKEVELDLTQVVSTGKSLAEVGPAPVDVQQIDIWLKPLAQESEGLQASYLKALQNRDGEDFAAASDHFTRIKDNLSQAVKEMLAAGWSLD